MIETLFCLHERGEKRARERERDKEKIGEKLREREREEEKADQLALYQELESDRGGGVGCHSVSTTAPSDDDTAERERG